MALSNDTILFVGLGNPVEKYKNNVIPRPVSIAFGITFSGLLTSSPNVASLEYPVNAKNHILALKIKFFIERPFVNGMFTEKFSELVTDIK